MKSFKITVTGSGTRNQIEISLLHAVQNLQFSNETDLCDHSDSTPFYEDETICADIKEE